VPIAITLNDTMPLVSDDEMLGMGRLLQVRPSVAGIISGARAILV
jgi:hypothetical protein